MWVPSLGGENPLEAGMVTHSSILAWRIQWTEEPDRLQSHVPRDQSIHQWCPAWPGQPGFMRIFHQHRAQHRRERSRKGPVLGKQSSSSTHSLHPP